MENGKAAVATGLQNGLGCGTTELHVFRPLGGIDSKAREIDYEGVPARVAQAEHLIAICLQTGRAKDRARVAMVREQAHLDHELLADILKRHQLEEAWKLWAME